MEAVLNEARGVEEPVRSDSRRGLKLAPSAFRPFAISCLTVTLAGHLLLALAVIPPWQNPDEPQHVAAARLRSRESGLDADAEREIVQSMAAHGWWFHYRRPTPDPLPVTFADGPARVVASYVGPPTVGPQLYYLVLGRAFDMWDVHDVLRQLYLMRYVSAAAALLTLVCVWMGTERLFGRSAALVVSAALALHPQFAIVSATAGPDAIANLAGGLFWWQGARFLAAPWTFSALAGMWGAAVAGFLSRRLAASLLVMAVLMTIAGAVRLRRNRVGTRVILAALSLIAIVVGWALTPAALTLLAFDPAHAAQQTVANLPRLPRFLEMLWESMWVSAGWLRYPPPPAWNVPLAIVCLSAAAGVVAHAVKRRAERGPIVFAVTLVAIQCAAIIGYHFGYLNGGAQGRYLFPVIPALLALLWLGLREWTARWEEWPTAVIMILVMALFNVAAWTRVILPAFAAWME